MVEYEKLREEIEALKSEVENPNREGERKV